MIRWLLIVLSGLSGFGLLSRPALAADCPSADLGLLADRLRAGITAEAVFGLPREDARWVLYPVTRDLALPDNYVPPDLVRTTAGATAPQGAQPLRRLILPDLEAMFAAARADGVSLAILSGYRSYDAQANLFRLGVNQQRARGHDQEQAEALANRFRARPGYSQHQLGTTLDLTSPEVVYGLGQRFGESQAGRWVRERAWQFGFVLPYTASGEARTGYAPEPWHVRWVGRELAAAMQADDYLSRDDRVADDYLVALDALLADRYLSCRP